MSREPPDPDEHARAYATLRPLLISIAYQMVGAVGEAEDIVQEASLRFHRAGREGVGIESPKAWLSTVVTRLAIDHVAILGFSDKARLDDGSMWPVVYALPELTPACEARIAALVTRAVG
jgi:DNA-directed RNA polymerase specialized sigma24 family protein